jgi:hypothetical protein
MLAERTAAIAEELLRSFAEHVLDDARPDSGDALVSERLREAYDVLFPLATAVVTATFEVQLARTLQARFGLDIDIDGSASGP